MWKKGSALAACVTLAALSAGALASPVSNGNLVVVRINGTSGAASPGFLEEYTTSGSLVQSIPLPTLDGANNNQTCTLPGNVTTSEGYLALSTNGQYLTLACNDATLGTTVTTGLHDRVVARVDMNGNVDTTTHFNTGAGGWNARSAVMDGNNIWVTGSANNKAVLNTTFGSTTATVISNTFAGAFVVKAFNDGVQNQLYMTADNNTTTVGIYSVGAGLPTGTGISPSRLTGFPTSNSPDQMNPADFWFANPSTIYLADSRATASGGGLQKWTLSAGVWSRQYTLNSGLTNGLFGLTGAMNGGVATLFATTADNKLVSITDTGAASNFDTILTGVSGNVFRGLVLTTPEPASLTLLVLGGLALIRRRYYR